MEQNLLEQTVEGDLTHFGKARSILQKWTEAVASGRIEEILNLYAKDAILVPTLTNEIAVTEDGRRSYFEFFLSNGRATCAVDHEDCRIDRDRCTVTIGGIYTFSFQRAAGVETVPARFLFTFEEFNGRWLITGHHSSRCV
ncbi:nuclear transport factor 2 family protein [Roseibium sp. HPY-6]|uniref:nuclear transport factor 2 family protein n=1 Tax=Roseibium sp. HPY-6 TaxID=3229852 RepID=UPI00338D405A